MAVIFLGSIGNIAKGIEGWKDAKGQGLMGRLKGVAGNISGERQDDMLSQVLENQEQMMQAGSNTATNGTGAGTPTFSSTDTTRGTSVMDPNIDTKGSLFKQPSIPTIPPVPNESQEQLDKLT